MAGYIGSKAVVLSTTGSEINGDSSVTGSLTVGGATTLATADINGGTIDGTVIGGTSRAAGLFTALTSNGIADNAAATALTLSAAGGVIAGATDPSFAGAVDGDLVASRGVNVAGNNVTKSKRVALTTTFQDVLICANRATFKVIVSSCDASAGASTGSSTIWCCVSNDYTAQSAASANVGGTLVLQWKAGNGYAEINRTLQARTTVASSESFVITVEIHSDYARTTEGTGVGSCFYLI
jgi:hypothetical protein